MAELNYKASNIAKAERAQGANFFKTLEGFGTESPSVSDILFVLEAGGLNEDEASKMVDEKGLVEAIKTAVEAIQSAGFLANLLTESQKAKVQESAELISQHTGDKAKA